MATNKKNLVYWNQSRKVPESAKKSIEAGRQRGLTAINPTWQKQIMTEMFGPFGVGWKVRFDVHDPLVIEATGEQIVRIDAYVRVKFPESDEWTDEFCGFGSGKLISREKSGIFVDDDVWKKAATDALSNILQYWGVGADVRYLNMEEEKYTAPTPPLVEPLPPIQPIGPKKKADEIITAEQAEHIETVFDKCRKPIPNMIAYLNGLPGRENSPIEDLNQLTYREYSTVIEILNRAHNQ